MVTLQVGEKYLHINEKLYMILDKRNLEVKMRQIGGEREILTLDHEDFKTELKQCKFRFIPTPKPTRINVSEFMMEFQLNVIGHTSLEVDSVKNWHKRWILNGYEYLIVKKHCVKMLQRVFKFNRLKAINTFNFFFDNFGLTVGKNEGSK